LKEYDTNVTIKGNIAQHQIHVVLSMLKSWNIDAEVTDDNSIQQNTTALRQRAAQRAKGILHKYANNALVEKEKDAWANHVVEKYGNI
jgi:hypothetical protein